MPIPPQIVTNVMSSPLNTGGRNILDLTSHNKAIKIIMKLKKILDHSESRPMASDAAIAIIIGCLPLSIQSKNAKDSIHEILNTGTKYHLAKISLKHKMELPAWHNIRKYPNSKSHIYKQIARCSEQIIK